MNLRLSLLILFCSIDATQLRADDGTDGGVVTNLSAAGPNDFVGQAGVVPVQQTGSPPVSAAGTNSRGQISAVPPVTASEPEKSASPSNMVAPVADNSVPRYFAPVGQFYLGFALAGALAVSVGAAVFTWRVSRQQPAAVATAPARAEPPALLAPNLLPVISQAVKEALMHELAAQRRELLASQQAAASELAGLARRLEAVQSPLLERLNGLRPAALPAVRFQRELPIKIFCACGQKYSFEVQPVDGRIPFAVACPACGQDGTHQANQVIARLLNGITQPLPSPVRPGVPAFHPAQPDHAPQLADAVKPAVSPEFTPTRAEVSKTVPLAVVRKNQNGLVAENHAGDFVAKLLAEGQSLVDAGELDKARKCVEAALVLQPNRAEALVKMGSVLDKLDRADEALQFYDRAIAIDDSLTIAYLNKGGLFNRLARYDEALRCYEQALHKQKKSAA